MDGEYLARVEQGGFELGGGGAAAPGKRTRTEQLHGGQRGGGGGGGGGDGEHAGAPRPAPEAGEDPFAIHLGKHDLSSPRFAGDPLLEACFDDKARLRVGMSGPSVKAVKAALADDGLDVGGGEPDVYDAATGAAVQAFKRKYKLGFEQFNDVGPGTMRKLDELFPGSAPIPPPQPEPQPDDIPANPPEGLRYLDGMTPTTLARKPFVRKLQSMLSDKMNAELVKNGELDDETLALLNAFQSRQGLARTRVVDAATAKALSGGGGGGGGGGTNKFPAFNPRLEDLGDLIWLQHQMSLQQAIAALEQLKVDLAKPVAHNAAVGWKLLELAARAALSTLPALGAVSVAAASKLHPEDDHVKDVLHAALEAPFDPLKDDFDKSIEHFFEGKGAPKAPPQAAPDYVEAQRGELITESTTVQERFLQHGKGDEKQGLRSFAPGDENATEDPRVKRAEAALEGARTTRAAANQKQYSKSLLQWSKALAGTDLGEVDPKDPSKGLHLEDHDKVKEGRGVVMLRLGVGQEHTPGAPVQVNPNLIEIRGLPEDAAKHLVGQRVGDLPMPVLLELVVNGAKDLLVFELARSGKGVQPYIKDVISADFDAPARVRAYLARKGAGASAEPSDANVEKGVRLIMEQELADVRIAAIKAV